MEVLAATSTPYVAAAFGLAGSLIGGLIAGTVSLRVARQAREAAESSWMRDSRRGIFDAMRGELELTGSAKPPERYNPFMGTRLGDEYQRRRYG